MPRIKLDLPADFSFQTKISIRITDINYGGHVGNDSVLSIIHEARVQFLKQCGYEELMLGSAGLIMRDVAIEFLKELFYGDHLMVSVKATEFTKIGFDLYYKLEQESGSKPVVAALAKTGMVCYDYHSKKIMAVPEEVKQRLSL